MKNIIFTPPYKYYATMTFILLLLLQFSAFAQNNIYSLTDKKTNGTPTVRLNPDLFLYYKSLTNASNVKAQQEFSDATSRNRDQVTQANIIPIGILNAEIDIPDEKEKDFVLMASPIQKDIFQAKVQFQLSPKLLHTNLDNQIESIEISFDNGDNWKTYKYAEQLISYQFSKIGEQPIGFKINSKKGTYVTFAMVDVKQLVRPSFVEPKRVSAPSVKGGRIAAGVNGAEYRIIMGCDGIFDKPVIIAEGFDIGNNTNLDDLTAKYFTPLELYRNNGYDLVLVNYDNGRTWIQDNAQVLKAVINQVNNTKVGNNKLVVIGESMSGLVARWALREMENAGQNPNVSHFVAFDTPMRGANVPTGVIALRRSQPNVPLAIAGFYFNLPEVYAIDSPAAKQMLLTQQGTSPAPEFFEFQTQINNLGYPSQFGIKNVALINGALNGTPQRRYTAQDNGNGGYTETDQGPLNQGDPIFDFSIFLLSRDRVWTHTINNSSLVYQRTRLGNQELIFANNLPLNYDSQPGGRIVANTGSVYTSFSFVPTFSSIDYRGTLNNDNDYYFNIRNFRDEVSHQVTNAALTPFAAIYGDNANDLHAKPRFETEAFNTFGRIELGMTNNGGCVGCGGGTGLAGTYFNNNNLVNDANSRTSNTNEGINFASGEGRYTPFHGSIEIPPNGTFTRTDISARWEGTFQAPIAATYNFNVRTDDGTRVWFDGVQKVIDWGNYPPKDHPFQVNLNAGDRRNITIEWFQGGGQYEAKLLWGFNGIETFIPACHLFPVTTDCNFTVSASASPLTVSCGGTSTLTATCTGSGCSGVSYNWKESGSIFNTASGSPVSINLRNQNGTYNYNLTASKIGCGDKTSASNPAINVILCSGQRGMSISNSTGLTNVSNSINQGSFKVNSTNVNWVISNVPTWASINTSTGGNGTTDINVSFQANNGAYRDATLSVIDITDITPDQTITISQQGSGGGCTSPTPTLSASPSTVPSTLTASGCSGTVNWSNGVMGNSISVSAAGTYTATCTNSGCSMSSSGSVTVTSSGGSCNYTEGQYMTTWFGNEVISAYICGAKFYAKNNSGDFKSKSWLIGTGRFTAAQTNCFEESDPRPAGCSGGGCTSPTPTLSASSTTVPSTLTASGCSGTVNWSTGASGSSISVATAGTYTATCTNLTCTISSVGSITVTSSGGSCTYTNGQFMTEWFGNETVRAYVCGTKYYAKNDAGYFKSKSWLTGTGRFTTAELNCFEEVNPGCGGLRIAAIQSEEIDNNVTIYPNPTTGKIKIVFSLQKAENVWLNLYDVQGKSMDLRDFEGKIGRNEMEYDLQNYPSGAYFVDFQSSAKREVLKVMKVN